MLFNGFGEGFKTSVIQTMGVGREGETRKETHTSSKKSKNRNKSVLQILSFLNNS